MKFIEKDTRPWGSYFVIHDEVNYKLKRIEVNPGMRLSYQYHYKRSETWTVVQGSGIFTLDGEDLTLKEGDSVSIPKLSRHRIYNNNSEILIFIEVQTGTYFGEDDIVRVEDDFNRT